MSEQGDFKPPELNDVDCFQAELDQLYGCLIDTYGVDISYERQEIPSLLDRSAAFELPRLRGLAAVKAAIFGHTPMTPQFPSPETYTVIERGVDMPILPARNSADTRKAMLLRRQSCAEESKLLFQSWSERSEAEAAARGVHTKTIDASPAGTHYRGLGNGKITAETGQLWRDYLSKVKAYRDSGEYDSHGYGPFILQNHDLLVAMEEAMGFTENDLEIKKALKQQYDQEQSALFTKQIVDRLADVPYSEWWRPSDYSPTLDGPRYDQRSRKIVLAPAEASLPELSITQIETNPVLSTVPAFSLKLGQSTLDLTEKLFPDIPYPTNPQRLADQTLHEMIHTGLLNVSTVEAISEHVAELNAPFHIGAKNEACILLRALWNEAMKKHSATRE